MTSYVRQFFRSKRRKTESSDETNGETFGPPRISSSAAILTTSSTTASLDFIISSLAVPMSENGQNQRNGNHGISNGISGGGIGHRRQHSSPGHLQQFQHPTSSGSRFRRRNTETEVKDVDPPPKFENRSPFIQSSAHLDAAETRMILIETESRVLFDTATVIPLRYGSHPGARSVSACGQFQFLRKRKDTLKLSQMIFGAVPNLKTSESFRIHVLEEEGVILVSKTFQIPKGQKRGGATMPGGKSAKTGIVDGQTTSSDSDSQSTIKSLDGWKPRSSRSIMTTPEVFSRVRHVSLNFGEDETTDSHPLFGSPNSSLSLPRAFSPPHRISRHRRRQLAVTTSLSETTAVPIPSNKGRSRMSSMCSSQTDDDHQTVGGYPAKNMRNVALGILVPIRQRDFLMTHIPLIEAEMSRFETRVMNAANHSPTFLLNISKSWEELSETICQLHNAPRLKHPYWLALNEKCVLDGKTLAGEFCIQLAYLVRKYDRKETGYFLSNLVTALLMHHMSWVASVAAPPLALLEQRRNTYRVEQIFGIQAPENAAPTVGYNALMAQYLEIAGACGNMRSAKVCILGDDVEILASVCSVLTFFIRCSTVQHIDNDRMWEVPPEQPFSPVDVSGSPSASTSAGCGHQFPTVQMPTRHLQTPETSSGAMMRRLRNNNSEATSSSVPSTSGPSTSAAVDVPSTSSGPGPSTSMPIDIPSTSSELGPSTSTASDVLMDDPNIPSTSAGPISSSASTSNSQGMNVIDRTDFPCLPTIANSDEMFSRGGLGRSMFAGPLDAYCSHFVMSALMKQNANMPEVYSKMLDEVRCTDSPCHRASATYQHQISTTSSQSTSSSIAAAVAELTPESVLIVADIDQMTVKVLSSEGSDEVTSPSESVVSMLEQFVGIHAAYPFSAEFLVRTIEDALAHLVAKSLTLVELVRIDQTNNPTSMELTPDRVRSIIECDHSDLRLIVNVAAVYWPPVLQSVLG